MATPTKIGDNVILARKATQDMPGVFEAEGYIEDIKGANLQADPSNGTKGTITDVWPGGNFFDVRFETLSYDITLPKACFDKL